MKGPGDGTVQGDRGDHLGVGTGEGSKGTGLERPPPPALHTVVTDYPRGGVKSLTVPGAGRDRGQDDRSLSPCGGPSSGLGEPGNPVVCLTKGEQPQPSNSRD